MPSTQEEPRPRSRGGGTTGLRPVVGRAKKPTTSSPSGCARGSGSASPIPKPPRSSPQSTMRSAPSGCLSRTDTTRSSTRTTSISSTSRKRRSRRSPRTGCAPRCFPSQPLGTWGRTSPGQTAGVPPLPRRAGPLPPEVRRGRGERLRGVRVYRILADSRGVEWESAATAQRLPRFPHKRGRESDRSPGPENSLCLFTYSLTKRPVPRAPLPDPGALRLSRR
jgi:hypothetical protein